MFGIVDNQDNVNHLGDVIEGTQRNDYTTSLVCNRSLHFNNKWRFHSGPGTGFFPIVWTPQELIDHLKAGFAITTGFYGKVSNYDYPKTTTDHWVSSRLLIIDCDNRSHIELSQDDFVKQYALCIYATPSSSIEQPRSRAIFLLDTPIKSKEQYKLLAETLVHHTLKSLDPDPNACKLTQRVYGSKRGYFHEYPTNVLPLAVMDYQVNLYKAEKYLYGDGNVSTRKVSTSNSIFFQHSENTDNLLAGEMLAVGERNDRINQASYNLTVRGMDDIAIMRKLLPLATFSGLGTREAEHAIDSGIKGANRDAQSRTYSDNRNTMTNDAKRLLLAVMQYKWKSGYTTMVAVAMCKMFSKQGQGFYLTDSLIERMTGFDKSTIAKHVQIILKTKIFREEKKRKKIYRVNFSNKIFGEKVQTLLQLDGCDYEINISIFDRLLENRTNARTMTPAELLTFCQIAIGTTQRKEMQYSHNHAQEAINGLIQLGVLVREGLRYWFVSLTGMLSGNLATHDIVGGNSGTGQMIELKPHDFLQQKHELERSNEPEYQFIDIRRKITS